MAADPGNLAGMVAAQSACQRCPLHHSGPVAVSSPLHVASSGIPLVVMDRPLGDVISPRHDVRFRRLRDAFPLASSYAATYAVSCRSEGEPSKRSVESCRFHRRIELAVLRPPLIVAIGDEACRLYLDQDESAVHGRAWTHGTGALVLTLRDEIGPFDEDERLLLGAYLTEAARVAV